MGCLFCKIIQKEIKAAIIAENEEVIAILDINPVSTGHTLLISKNHVKNITELKQNDWNSLFITKHNDKFTFFQMVVNRLQETFQPQGFNFISNMGEVAYQSIFHFHLHIIPKYEKNEGFIWTAKPNLKYNLSQVAEKLKSD